LPPHPSEAERERMFDAIAHARQDNAFLSWISGVFLGVLKPLDIDVPEAAKRKQLLSQRRQIGC
jgi:hypothetical protein